MSSCLTPVIQQRKQWSNTQKSGDRTPLTARGDFFTAFLLCLFPKESGAIKVALLLSAFFITKSFKEKLRCGNLLIRVHERYSDLIGGAAQAHEIGQVTFCIKIFNMKTICGKAGRAVTGQKNLPIGGSNAVGYVSPIITFPLRGGRRTAQGPVCEKNRTLVGNCLTRCIVIPVLTQHSTGSGITLGM